MKQSAKSIDLPGRQRATSREYALSRDAAEKILVQMQKVYESLSEPEIAEIETIALERTDYCGKRK